MDEKELKKILEEQIGDRMKTEFMKGVCTGYIAACKIIKSGVSNIHNAKDIHRYVAAKCKEAENIMKGNRENAS